MKRQIVKYFAEIFVPVSLLKSQIHQKLTFFLNCIHFSVTIWHIYIYRNA